MRQWAAHLKAGCDRRNCTLNHIVRGEPARLQTRATGSGDLSTWVWDAETGAGLIKITEHGWPVVGVASNHDGTRLATASWDWTARIWDLDISRVCERAQSLTTRDRVASALGGTEPTACMNLR